MGTDCGLLFVWFVPAMLLAQANSSSSVALLRGWRMGKQAVDQYGSKMAHYISWKSHKGVFFFPPSWNVQMGCTVYDSAAKIRHTSSWKLILATVPGLCFISFSRCNEKDTRGVSRKWANSLSGSENGNQKGGVYHVQEEHLRAWIVTHLQAIFIHESTHPPPQLSPPHKPCLSGWRQKHPPTARLNARVSI